MENYDLIITGGGTSGCATAYVAAKNGLKVLLLEKTSQLGGAITSGLVVPVMNCGKNQINTSFYKKLIDELKKVGGQIEYQDNPGWFNPELAKIVLDKILDEVGVEIIFNSKISSIKKTNNKITEIDVIENEFVTPQNILKLTSKYFVDTTGDGYLAKLAGCNFLQDNKNYQPMSLRFIMSGIDIKIFAKWLKDFDTDRSVTTVEEIENEIHLSTAYTWDTNKSWALRPIFQKAIKEGVLTENDSNYFQIFTIAGMPGAIAFNCPRITQKLNPNSIKNTSFALKEGRKSILRISNFCKKYFPGFEKAYISNIADNIGIRVSNRIEGDYIYTIEDLKSGKIFKTPALVSNYPVDVHSSKKDSSTLEKNGEYQLPIESLLSKDYTNLFFAGRLLSSDYLSQGALRVQASCFSMGEAIANHIKGLIK